METIPDLPKPPYPGTIKYDGWPLALDFEQIRQSDAWALAKPEIKGWLLMIFVIAWVQFPCGSFPDDDEVIAAKIGMPDELFQKHRKILMRGWWKASDGRLYQDIMIRHVKEMLVRRELEEES